VSKAQGRVAGDGSAAIEDLGNAIGRDGKPPGERCGRHAESIKLLGEMFSGMYC